MLSNAFEEVVGRETAQDKKWISFTTLKKIRIRKDKQAALNNNRPMAAKAAAQNEYNEAHREARRSTGAAKSGHIDSLARQAEAVTQRSTKARKTSPGSWQEHTSKQTNRSWTKKGCLYQSTSINPPERMSGRLLRS